MRPGFCIGAIVKVTEMSDSFRFTQPFYGLVVEHTPTDTRENLCEVLILEGSYRVLSSSGDETGGRDPGETFKIEGDQPENNPFKWHVVGVKDTPPHIAVAAAKALLIGRAA